MSLESGQYYVYTAAGGLPIGSRPVKPPPAGERRPIIKLPEGSNCVWQVKRLDNGNYELNNLDVIVGGVAGKDVLAYVDHEGPSFLTVTTEWVFMRDVRNADSNAYVITMANVDDPNAWVVREPEPEPEPWIKSDVVLRPFIVGLSNPPTYPPNKVFIFKKVDA